MILGLFAPRTHPPYFTYIAIGKLDLYCARSSEMHPSHNIQPNCSYPCLLVTVVKYGIWKPSQYFCINIGKFRRLELIDLFNNCDTAGQTTY